jgi:hypothetical protein
VTGIDGHHPRTPNVPAEFMKSLRRPDQIVTPDLDKVLVVNSLTKLQA